MDQQEQQQEGEEKEAQNQQGDMEAQKAKATLFGYVCEDDPTDILSYNIFF
jgi:hypothetical protein